MAKKQVTKTKKRKKVVRIRERREHARHQTPGLYLTELVGDYQYLRSVQDLSESGVLLNNRVKSEDEISILRLRLSDAETLELSARPLYDRKVSESFGTAYKFLKISKAQLKSLRSYLRNLD